MSLSVFTLKEQSPTQAEIESALGNNYPLWQRLENFMLEAYSLPGVLNYGGKNYGWHLWYRRGSKPLLTLYPQSNGLVAQVVLGKKDVEKALSLKLGEKVGTALRDTPAFHDGKWLFISAASLQEIEDIIQLILVKSRPVKR